VAAGLAIVAADIAAMPQAPPLVSSYLTSAAGFTASDLNALEAGQVLSNVVSKDEDAEIAVTGAVKIRASRAFVLQYYNQMISYVDGRVTLQYGTFSRPPALADVRGLTFEPGDVQALKSCQPGDCDLKLGARGILALRPLVGFDRPGYEERAQGVMRQAVVDYAAAYLAQGDAALATYNDRGDPVSLAQQFRGILANAVHLPSYAPALRTHLENFPRSGPLAGGKDTLYWVKENYGNKPTVSIVHMVTYDDPKQPGVTMVAQKQIYASHFLEGSMAIGSIVERESGAGGHGVSYLLYGNRSRGDLLRSGFGGLRRSVARDQARKAAVQTLGTIQEQLERALGLR
jgi:hypothetical protein